MEESNAGLSADALASVSAHNVPWYKISLIHIKSLKKYNFLPDKAMPPKVSEDNLVPNVGDAARGLEMKIKSRS